MFNNITITHTDKYSPCGDLLKCLGSKIISAELLPEALRIQLDNGKTLSFSDEGQSCCEHRFMKTDDDLPSFIGAILYNVYVSFAESFAESIELINDVEEIAFLRITTSSGVITVNSHNIHNGFYGGFDIICRISDTPTNP